MTEQEIQRLSNLIDSFNLQSLLFEGMAVVVDVFEKACEEWARRYPGRLDPLSLDGLESCSREKSHAFLCLLLGLQTVEDRLLPLVWAVLVGDPVQKIDVDYRFKKQFRITIVVGEGSTEQTYESDNIFALKLLTFLDFSLEEGKPVYKTFYGLDVAC